MSEGDGDESLDLESIRNRLEMEIETEQEREERLALEQLKNDEKIKFAKEFKEKFGNAFPFPPFDHDEQQRRSKRQEDREVGDDVSILLSQYDTYDDEDIVAHISPEELKNQLQNAEAKQRLRFSIASGIAGAGSGAMATVILHPLDLVTTRFQCSRFIEKTATAKNNLIANLN